MKKLFFCTLATLLLSVFAPTQVFSSIPVDPTTVVSSRPAESERSETLTARLNEIKTLDKSNLNFSEKRQLRKETRSIKKELAELSGGVYLSAGAIILIALLLIILL